MITLTFLIVGLGVCPPATKQTAQENDDEDIVGIFYNSVA